MYGGVRFKKPVCKVLYFSPSDSTDLMSTHLTFQEEKDSGFDEVGVHTLSTSSLRHAVIFRISMTEQSANKDEHVK